MNTLDIALRLEVAEPFSVVGGSLREALSERTHARLEITTTACPDFQPGSAARVELHGVAERAFNLVLGRAAFLEEKNNAYRFALDLYDPLWLAGFTQNIRKFRHKTAREVVSALCAEHRIAVEWRLTRELRVREYTTQYRESNLAFIERLLEFEGIYYAWRDDGTLVFADRSPAAEFVAHDGPFELVESEGALSRDGAGIHAIERSARLRPGRVTLGDYNWKKPRVALRESGVAERDGDLELYDYPAGFREPEQGRALAALRVEAERVTARTVEGRGNVAAFAPGLAFSFGGPTGDLFGGDYLIARVEHRASGGDAEEGPNAGGKRYENSFQAIPLTTPFRPALRTPRPRVSGTHTAMVRGPGESEIHTDEHGRFKAQFHWDREATGSDADSRWLRILQESQTSMALARVGWEMFVSYVGGDPDRPLGLARAINGVAAPAYALPGNMNMMTVKTPSSPATGGYNELKMDDSAGAQHISLRAEKDLDALVKNDKTETIGNDETHTVGTDLSRIVSGDETITIGGNLTQTYGRNHKLLVEKNRTLTVGGSESTKVGKGQSLKTANDNERVGTLRLTVAGSFKVPDFKKMVKSAAMTFVSKASPGGAALYAQVASVKKTLDGAKKAGGFDAVLQKTAKSSGESALNAAAKTLVEGKGVDEAWKAAQGKLEAGVTSLLPGATGLQGQLTALEKNLDSVIPTQASFNAGLEGAANELTGGIYGSLKKKDYSAALDQFIDLFFAGSIGRSAKASMMKMVGGLYITAAIGNVEWKAGYGYLETVGGVKLTAVLGKIAQTVNGKLLVTVGGAIMRSSTTDMTLSALATKLTVGALFAVKTDKALELRGAKIKIDAGLGFDLKVAGGELKLTPASLTIKGDLNLKAGKDVILTSPNLNFTK